MEHTGVDQDHTPDAAAALAGLRAGFDQGAMLPLAHRRAALLRLRAALDRLEPALFAALEADLGKAAFDTYTGEILHTRQEIAHTLANLPRWAMPRRVATRLFHWPARASYEHRPRGAVLILSPWNYPVQLALVPLVSAVAAGNCVLLKPSELAPATAEVLRTLVADVFEPAHVRCCLGGPDLAAALTAQPFDYIFFTGSTAVGRKVAQAAAANLVEYTLELGGRNPCVVDASTDLAVTARRIAWAKFLNAGQTCIAPDHVWVEAGVMEPFLRALGDALVRFYGADGRGMQRVVNAQHFQRLAGLLGHGRVVHGGGTDAAALHIQPTVLTDLPPDAPILQQEVFGPILPVLPWQDQAALIRTIGAAPSPLAIYLHTRHQALIRAVSDATRSGAVVVNDHIVQATVPDLPFGGVGASGQGRYHGRAGFEAFSYTRSLLEQSARIDVPMRYPPYGNRLALVKRWMR